MNNNMSPHYRTTSQPIQTRYVRFELLNHQFQVIGELNGVATGGNISIDATTDVRRTGSIQMTIQKSTVNLGLGSPFWLDKYIRVFVGIESLMTGKIEWYNCGLFIIDTPTYEYNATANTISLSLLDLMAKLTGTRNGYVEHAPVTLKAGESIRQAFIATLEMAGFKNYIISEPPAPGLIPNDLEFGQGSTYYNILSGLRDIYPNYEMFFDTNGTFVYRPIPTGVSAPVLVDDDIWKNIMISENSNVNLNEVKNAIEVFGRIHEPTHLATAKDVTISGSTIKVSLPSLIAYTNDMVYGFETDKAYTLNQPKLYFNSLPSLSILDDNKVPIKLNTKADNEIFCVQYTTSYELVVNGNVEIKADGESAFLNLVNSKYHKEYIATSEITEGTVRTTGNYWRWLGHLQAKGYAEDTNPQSPYYVNGTVGKIYLPLFNGDYSNCVTDDLAQQRAEFELYLHSGLKDNITLQCVPVFWFDVNILVNYTSGRTNETNKYLIKNINFGLDVQDTMTVTMMRYYPISE